jgi:hypothetical protein
MGWGIQVSRGYLLTFCDDFDHFSTSENVTLCTICQFSKHYSAGFGIDIHTL